MTPSAPALRSRARAAGSRKLSYELGGDATAADRLNVTDGNDYVDGKPCADTKAESRGNVRGRWDCSTLRVIGAVQSLRCLSLATIQAVRRADSSGHDSQYVRIRDLDANHQSWLK
jgi:Flp pilus assembly protein TadG